MPGSVCIPEIAHLSCDPQGTSVPSLSQLLPFSYATVEC